MDIQTAQRLIELNNRFYRNQYQSFASTREHPWHGWSNIEVLDELYSATAPELTVFDLACGNLRFESYLSEKLPSADFRFYAVDNCDALVPPTPPASYQNLDVMAALLSGQPLGEQFAAPACDLSVSFGFMHHVPVAAWREEVLLSLIGQTRPGGYVVISLWQFLNNSTLARKAQVTHRLALQELKLPALDAGDYLLGWKDVRGEYRYCHSFSEPEIDQLVAAVAGKAVLTSRFVADGRSDNLNSYLVLRVL